MSIGWHEETNDAREEIAQAIARVQQGHGVLIVTGMFGGTPSKLSMTFSMTPGARPGARRVVHDTSAGEMGRIAARVLTLGTVDEIEQCLLGAFGRSEVVTEVNTP